MIIQKLDNALILLNGKRKTLEDKAIAGNFLELLILYREIGEELHQLSKKIDEEVNHTTTGPIVELLRNLSDLNCLVLQLLEGCLKALNYDYNYFEQYYEYDFVAKLDEQKLQSRLLDLKSHIVDLCQYS